MKLNIDSYEILLGSDACIITDSLLNFFSLYIENVAEYNELDEDVKKAIPERIFELLTRKETDDEIIEKLFKVVNPVKFGFINNEESNKVQEVLRINEDTSGNRLLELRNEIVEYTYRLITSGTLIENDKIKAMNKMSAFVAVIDTLRVKQGYEV